MTPKPPATLIPNALRAARTTGPVDHHQAAAAILEAFAADLAQHIATVPDGDAIVAVWRFTTHDDDAPTNRGHAANRAWVAAVLERDSHACTACGRPDRLQAHHVRPWADAPDARYDVDNGTTLCTDCHAEQHPRYAALIRNHAKRNRG